MKARVKFRQMPGNVNKRVKIAMLEGKGVPEKWIHPWSRDFYAKHRKFKAFKNVLRSRERAVLKRQAQAEINR